MTKRNERTSAEVAAIAGRLLAAEPWDLAEFSWPDIRAVAASALTQTRDHAEHETIRKGGIPKGHKLIKRHKPVVRNGKVRRKA